MKMRRRAKDKQVDTANHEHVKSEADILTEYIRELCTDHEVSVVMLSIWHMLGETIFFFMRKLPEDQHEAFLKSNVQMLNKIIQEVRTLNDEG